MSNCAYCNETLHGCNDIVNRLTGVVNAGYHTKCYDEAVIENAVLSGRIMDLENPP